MTDATGGEGRERYLLLGEETVTDFHMLATLLEGRGVDVDTARTPGSAVRRLESGIYDCLVTFLDAASSTNQFVRLRAAAGSVPIVFLVADGSRPSAPSIVQDPRVHVLPYEDANLEGIVDHLEGIVASTRTAVRAEQYGRLQDTIRGVLASQFRANSPEEFERTTCERLASSDLVIAAWTARYDPEAETLVPQIAAGIDARRLAPVPTADRRPDGLGVDDTDADTTVTLPIRGETEVRGTLTIVTTRDLDGPERDLLSEFGDDLRAAIDAFDDESTGSVTDEALETYHRSFSHELRNLLQTARAALEEHGVDATDDELAAVREVLDRIERLDREATVLTQRSIDDPKLSIERLDDIVAEVVERTGLSSDRVTVRESRAIAVYRPLAELLFENLLRNVEDHAGPDAEVRVGTLESGFFVEDTGPGLPEAPPESLFEWGTSVDGNTGMGLAIVERIVRLHDWQVTVTESEDGGARFEITGVASDTVDG